jgi:hypothetical protein
MAAFHISSQSPKCGFFVLSRRASDRSHRAVRCALRLCLKPLFWEVGRSPRRRMEKPRKTRLDHGFTSLSGGLNKAAMFDDLHFKSTKVAGEEIVAFDLSASLHQHQTIAKAIRQRLHNWLIQALEAVTEPRHHREPVRYPVGPDG